MTRPYCSRCETEVILDSDGKSCPNCGRLLIGPVEPVSEPTPATTRTRTRKPTRSAA